MRRAAVLTALASCAVVAAAVAAADAAGEFSFSAKIDKTSVEANTPLTLVLTLSGDITGVELPKIELPDGFAVGATSQATNFTMHQGVTQRSIGLTYVIVPQREGTFQLGPFVVRRGKDEYRSEPIDVTVTKAAPSIQPAPEGERFLL